MIEYFIEEWYCNPGQGEYGKYFNHIRNLNLEECKEKCVDAKECIGVDYTNTDNYKTNSSCRLYKNNKVRKDSGPDNRKYCEKSRGIIL